MTLHPPQTFKSSDILAIASAFRKDGAHGTLCFGTDEKPILLSRTLIYAVKFHEDDNDIWAVRVALYAGSTLTTDAITTLVDYEMTTLTRLSKVGFKWSPKLIGGDSSFDNPIQNPYLVLRWIHGTPLEWTPATPAEQHQRHKILRQLMDIQLELVRCTQKSQPETSTLKYFMEMIDNGILYASNEEQPTPNLRSRFLHRALIRHAVHDDLESSRSALWHDNLAGHKVIVDDDFDITGIIDWSLARFRPSQFSLRFPRILGVNKDEPDPSPTLLSDRQFAVYYLSSLVPPDDQDLRVDTSSPQTTGSLAKTMRTIVSDPNVDWRDMVLEACFSKGNREWTEKRSWLLDTVKGDLGTRLRGMSLDKLVEDEVDNFLKEAHQKNHCTREELLESRGDWTGGEVVSASDRLEVEVTVSPVGIYGRYAMEP